MSRKFFNGPFSPNVINGVFVLTKVNGVSYLLTSLGIWLVVEEGWDGKSMCVLFYHCRHLFEVDGRRTKRNKKMKKIKGGTFFYPQYFRFSYFE